jgi:hypothetical protein
MLSMNLLYLCEREIIKDSLGANKGPMANRLTIIPLIVIAKSREK